MATLFLCSLDNISLHLKNIFKENELSEDSVVEVFSITASDGKKYKTKHYSLDAILSVGYRIKSINATRFRQWATNILKQHLLNGYTISENRIETILTEFRSLKQQSKLNKKTLERIESFQTSILDLLKKPFEVHNHIHNNIQLTSTDLETKTIELLDKIIVSLDKQEEREQIASLKQAIQKAPNDHQAKKNVTDQLITLGDPESKVSQIIQGAKVAKDISAKTIDILIKIKDALS